MKADDGIAATPAQAIVSAPLSFGSLFAGIGGFDLGFERAGMACKWQVEIDDYANRVLAKHWPNVHRERDVREVGRHNLESVDVICGGFPCQDISIGNTGTPKGLDGDRSGLFFEAVRVVEEMQPDFVVMENVPAIFTRGIERVLRAVAEIGYDAEWFCVRGEAAGCPHKRDRFFLVAYARGTRWEGLEQDNSVFNPAQTTFPVNRHRVVDTWSSLVRGGGTRRGGDGISVAVDRRRLHGLGNAVVPQVAEWIGRRVMMAAGRTPAMCSDAARQDAGDWSH